MTVLLFHPEEISISAMHHFLLASERPKGQKVNIIEKSSSVIGGWIDGLEALRIIIFIRSLVSFELTP